MIKKCEYCGATNFFNKTGYCKNCDHRLTQDLQSDKPQVKNLNPLLKVVDETVLETTLDFDTTVERLMGLAGGCRESLTDGTNAEFTCQKDGDFWVRPLKNDYMGYVSGKVYTEDGKTKVLIQSKKERTLKGVRFFLVLYPFIFSAIAVVFLIIRRIHFTLTTAEIFGTMLVILFLAFKLLNIQKEIKNITSDLQIMKSEVIRRVRAIERWND